MSWEQKMPALIVLIFLCVALTGKFRDMVSVD